MFWRKPFKGMIRPGMALGFGDSRRIADRSSEFLVHYLRARRDPDLVKVRSFYRRAHLRGCKVRRLVQTMRPVA